MAETFEYPASRLAQEVKDQFGDTAGAQITEDMLLVWINNGIREIATAHPFLERSASTNLLAGVNVYSVASVFPSQRIQNYSMVTASGKPLKSHTMPEFRTLMAHTGVSSTAGTPTDYMVFGGSLTLWPTPDATVAKGLSIYFYQAPEDISSLLDTLTLPDRYYNALKEFVLAQAKVLNDDLPGAALAFTRHEQAVARQFARQEESPTDYYQTIGQDLTDEEARYF